MLSRVILIMTMLITMLPAVAQDMSIVGFAKQKHSPLSSIKIKKDKKQATLLLTTDKKGFKFKADGQTDVVAEEGDGILTLKVPHKTQFLTITHPDYGQYTWRVPGKSLRKKKCYHAYLQTYSPNEEYKLQKQWVVFMVSPAKAIVHVDSTLTRIMDGKAQFHLPLGKHPYMVEAPFYQTVKDTLEVTEEQKLILPVYLQPEYSYLAVKTPSTAWRILIDNQQIGNGEAVSSHLSAGIHRLSVFKGNVCYYDAPVEVGEAEKKVVVLTAADFQPRTWREQRKLPSAVSSANTPVLSSPINSTQTTAADDFAPIKAPVTIKAPDDDTEILLNREVVGRGTWNGILDEGFYIINTRKDSMESAVKYLWVNDEFPKEIKIGAPQVDYGFLNIHSNVMGANVFVNDSLMGFTPCIVENQPAGKTCLIRLEKAEYKPVEQTVVVLGNDMVDVELIMKRRHDD